MTSESGITSDASLSNNANDLVGLARVIDHVKENNVTWMVATMLAYQMGILDRFLAYGAGMCV
jgi:hypothetical protein